MKKIFFFIFFQAPFLIFILPKSQFSDSADYLLGGCLIANNKQIYLDFFSHHGPLIYFLISWWYKILGYCSLLLPRYFFYLLFLIVLFVLYRFSRSFKTIFYLFLLYAFLSIYYSVHLPLAETWLIFIVLITFVLLFSIVQFSFITAHPIYLLNSLFLLTYFLIVSKRKKLWLLILTFLPSLLFFSQIDLRSFWENVIIFNMKYYYGSNTNFLLNTLNTWLFN